MLLNLTYLTALKKRLKSVLNFDQNVSWKLLEIYCIPADLLDTLQWYGHQGMYCKKKTLIGWRNVLNMRWRAPDQEVDRRRRGERLCKKIAKHVIWTGRMLWIVGGWVGECFFRYRLSQVVMDKGRLNDCCVVSLETYSVHHSVAVMLNHRHHDRTDDFQHSSYSSCMLVFCCH